MALSHPHPHLCEHANECPLVCPCPAECYCKSNTCAPAARNPLPDDLTGHRRRSGPITQIAVGSKIFEPTPEQIDAITLATKAPQARVPRLGVVALISDGAFERLLLAKRDKEPNRGLWVIPGGGVQFGEELAEALKREVREEIGCEISIFGPSTEEMPSAVIQVIDKDEHRVILVFDAIVYEGRPVGSDDVSDAGYFTREQLAFMNSIGAISPVVTPILKTRGWLK